MPLNPNLAEYRNGAASPRQKLRQIPTLAHGILLEGRAAMAAAEQRRDLSVKERRRLTDQVRSQVLTYSAKLRGQVRAGNEQAARAISRERRLPGALTTSDALAWERLRPFVDSAVKTDAGAWGSLFSRLKRAADLGDDPLLRAARVMVPDALEAAGQPMGDEALDQLDMLVGDDNTRAAVELGAELKKGTYYLDMTLGALEYEFSVDSAAEPATDLVNWDGSTIPVPLERPQTVADRAVADVAIGVEA